MSEKEILPEVEDYVRRIFKEQFKPEHIYHNISHTIDVVKAVEKIGKASDLSDDEMKLIKIAAWFHDIGYVETVDGHEEISVNYAKNYLTENHFPREKIEKIASAIMATKVPQSPKDKFEEILCDADLLHLGTEKFLERNELFRVELERRWGKTFSNYEWLKNTIDFVTSHKYFTRYVKDKYQSTKDDNLLLLQKKFRKQVKKHEKEVLEDEKLKLEREKLAKKKEKERNPDRGIETMFRNVMRTHVEFSGMADNKANIMISVNTLLLGAIATILARKLDANPHLIIPTIVLSIVSLTTLILAILATRPNISHGTFTDEDIKEKKANLLFFGNFHKMPLDKFKWGMESMMNDREYLYGSMIKDFYFLGQVLGRKYQRLHVCYSIFMYGMVVSIVLFILFILLFPQGATDFGNILE